MVVAPGYLGPPTSDSEEELVSPVFTAFKGHNGTTSIKHLTNFTSSDFLALWYTIKEDVEKLFLGGRGQKCSTSTVDQFSLFYCMF